MHHTQRFAASFHACGQHTSWHECSETMTTVGLHVRCVSFTVAQVMWAHTAAAACHNDMKGRACWLSHDPGIRVPTTMALCTLV